MKSTHRAGPPWAVWSFGSSVEVKTNNGPFNRSKNIFFSKQLAMISCQICLSSLTIFFKLATLAMISCLTVSGEAESWMGFPFICKSSKLFSLSNSFIQLHCYTKSTENNFKKTTSISLYRWLWSVYVKFHLCFLNSQYL